MRVDYEQCKVIELPEFQTSIFGDSCKLWVLLSDKHSALSWCNIYEGRRCNVVQSSEDAVVTLLVVLASGHH